MADGALGDAPPSAVLVQMANPLVSRAIHVAAGLRIADQLRADARSAEDLAAATGTHAPSLYRLLRALASVGIFNEAAGRTFSITPLGQVLRSDVPGSL